MATPNGDSTPTTVGVIGGGAWGTALAIHCARTGHSVKVWAREPEVVAGINGPSRENTMFLPGATVPEGVVASSDLPEVLQASEVVLVVVPTPFVASTIVPHLAHLRDDHIIVSCTKGVLNDTLETVAEVLERVLPKRFAKRTAFLSGPSFATEVVAGKPTAVTIAAADESVAARAQKVLSTKRFRCYTSTDVIGVELGGALKNVLAIACGISDGLGCGANGRAALLTRGLNEIARIAVAKGADPLTLLGLSGIGDLVLTCTGELSRNRSVGLRIGRGEKLSEIQASMGGAVAEGVLTSRAAHQLAVRLELECPVIEGIYKVVHEGADPMETVDGAMSRELRSENAGLLDAFRRAPSTA